jgi:hypothetical protein
VVLMISTKATLIAALVYVLILVWKRIGSLASLAAAAAFSLAHVLIMVFQGKSLLASTELSRTLFAVFMPIVIIFCHKKNVIRLLRGEEPKFGAGNGHSDASNGQPASSKRDLQNRVSEQAGKPQKDQAEKITRKEQESA